MFPPIFLFFASLAYSVPDFSQLLIGVWLTVIIARLAR